jgi:cell division septal protein FtsQ
LPERDAVKAAVLQRLDGGLLGVSLDDVVEGVLALSWPREVRVRRVWPGS